MKSETKFHYSARISIILVMLGFALVIHLSASSNMSYGQQKGPTNASAAVNKSGSSILVPRVISNATVQIPRSLSNATMAKIGDLSIHLPTEPELPVYIVSSIGKPPYHYVSDFSKLYSECPEEVVILVHGRSNTEASLKTALEEFNTAGISIERNHYYFPIIGFLWPNSGGDDLISALINSTTKAPAAGNELAAFLTDFKSHCKDTTLRIAAHSMGTVVVYNAIVDLGNSPGWTVNNYKIESIHFLGSSLSREDPDKSNPLKPFGGLVENFVGQLHNLYSPDDDLLSRVGPFLGNTGASDKIIIPTNYKDIDVAKEIWNPLTMREDHLAYWGIRDKDHVIDDGAMNVVVSDWLRSTYGVIFDLPKSTSSPSNATVIPR